VPIVEYKTNQLQNAIECYTAYTEHRAQLMNSQHVSYRVQWAGDVHILPSRVDVKVMVIIGLPMPCQQFFMYATSDRSISTMNCASRDV